MQQLEDAKDRSSYVVQMDFTDEEGNAVVPVSVTWTLTDGVDVVNRREDVSVAAPAATTYIAIHGADLDAMIDGPVRYLTVLGMYVSSLTGETLPVRKAFFFVIEDYPG